MDQKPLLGMSINCGWFVKKSFVLPTLCTQPSVADSSSLWAHQYQLPMFGIMSYEKSHFEICHLKYITSFDFGHLNFLSGIVYCTVKYNPSPKGSTYTYLDHPEVFDWWAFS